MEEGKKGIGRGGRHGQGCWFSGLGKDGRNEKQLQTNRQRVHRRRLLVERFGARVVVWKTVG